MKVGDMVQLSTMYYDWITISPRKEQGVFLRDPDNMNLLNNRFSGRTADFRNTDLCLVLEVRDNHLLVVNPRYQTGLIHKEKVERISGSR